MVDDIYGSDHLIVGLDQLLDEIQGVRRRRTSHLQEHAFQTPGLLEVYSMQYE